MVQTVRGVVAHSAKEIDGSGRTIRRSTLELVDYEAIPPSNRPTTSTSRRTRTTVFGKHRLFRMRTRKPR